MRRLFISTLLCVLLLGGSCFTFKVLASSRKPPPSKPAIPRIYTVETDILERRDIQERLPIQGSVISTRESRIAAEVTGVVVWRRPGLRPGVSVKKGDELIRLDRSRYEQDLQRLEAQVDQAAANITRVEKSVASIKEQIKVRQRELEIAAGDYDRAKELRSRSVFSEREQETREMALRSMESAIVDLERQLDEAEAQLTIQAAGLKVAEAQRARTEIDLADTTIRAPYDGEIWTVLVEIGDTVAPNAPIVEIVSLDEVEVPVRFPASAATSVKVGAKVTFRLASADTREWEGEIVRIAPKVDEMSRTLAAYTLVENDTADINSRLLPGSFVVGEMEARSFENVYGIPREYFIDGQIFLLERSTLFDVWLETEMARGKANEGSATREEVMERITPEDRAELTQTQARRAVAFQPNVMTYANGLAIVKEGLSGAPEVVASNIDVMYDGAVIRDAE